MIDEQDDPYAAYRKKYSAGANAGASASDDPYASYRSKYSQATAPAVDDRRARNAAAREVFSTQGADIAEGSRGVRWPTGAVAETDDQAIQREGQTFLTRNFPVLGGMGEGLRTMSRDLLVGLPARTLAAFARSTGTAAGRGASDLIQPIADEVTRQQENEAYGQDFARREMPIRSGVRDLADMVARYTAASELPGLNILSRAPGLVGPARGAAGVVGRAAERSLADAAKFAAFEGGSSVVEGHPEQAHERMVGGAKAGLELGGPTSLIGEGWAAVMSRFHAGRTVGMPTKPPDGPPDGGAGAPEPGIQSAAPARPTRAAAPPAPPDAVPVVRRPPPPEAVEAAARTVDELHPDVVEAAQRPAPPAVPPAGEGPVEVPDFIRAPSATAAAPEVPFETPDGRTVMARGAAPDVAAEARAARAAPAPPAAVEPRLPFLRDLDGVVMATPEDVAAARRAKMPDLPDGTTFEETRARHQAELDRLVAQRDSARPVEPEAGVEPTEEIVDRLDRVEQHDGMDVEDIERASGPGAVRGIEEMRASEADDVAELARRGLNRYGEPMGRPAADPDALRRAAGAEPTQLEPSVKPEGWEPPDTRTREEKLAATRARHIEEERSLPPETEDEMLVRMERNAERRVRGEQRRGGQQPDEMPEVDDETFRVDRIRNRAERRVKGEERGAELKQVIETMRRDVASKAKLPKAPDARAIAAEGMADAKKAAKADAAALAERTPEPLRRKYGKMADDDVVARWNALQAEYENRVHEYDAAKVSPSAKRRNDTVRLGGQVAKLRAQIDEAELVLTARGMDTEAMWNDPKNADIARTAAKVVRPEGVSAPVWKRTQKMSDADLKAEYAERERNHQRLSEFAATGAKPFRKSSLAIERAGSRFAAIQAQQEQIMMNQLDAIAKQRGLTLHESAIDMEAPSDVRPGENAFDRADRLKREADDAELDRIEREMRESGEGGAAHPAVVRSVAGAAVGAAVGAAEDDEDRVRGSIIGAVLGLGLVNAPAIGRALLNHPIGKRLLTTAGDMPGEAFERKIAMIAEKAASDVRLGQTLRDVRAAIKIEYGKKIPAGALEAINDAMAGRPATLPPRMQRMVARLRGDLDAWSRELINSGAATGDMADIIQSNLGQYVTRSYRIFDDKVYGNRIRSLVRSLAEGKKIGSTPEAQLVNKTVAYLEQEMFPNLPLAPRGPVVPGSVEWDKIMGALGELIDKNVDTPLGALRQAKVGAKDLSIFKHREDIAPEIRALWGEYEDPLVNYARSVHKMSHMVASHAFLEDVRAMGLGRFLHEKEPTGIYTRKIAADASHPMAPLNGLYTTPEIADAFAKSFTGSNPPGWLRLYLRANAFTKMAKTVYAPVSGIRNILGNVGFAVANGHFSAGPTALRATVGAMNLPGKVGRAIDTPAMRTYLADLTERGVIGQSAHGGELADLLREAGEGADLNKLFTGLHQRAASVRGAVQGVGNAVNHAAQTFYSLGDDLWKINGYETEVARYRAAMPNAPLEEIKAKAARIVQDVYPTYSRIPEGVKMLRRQPFVGPFVSFPAEVLRTARNTLKAAKAEITDANPAVRRIGATRVAGMLAVTAGVPGVVAASRMLTGVSRRDEADLRLSLPEWQKNHSLLHLGRGADGSFRMLDLSYSDPHSILRAPLIALMAGEDFEEKLTGAAQALGEPFLHEEMLFGAGVDVLRNRTAEGHEINNPQAPLSSRVAGNVAHVEAALEPGAFTTGRRLVRAARGEVSPGGRRYDLGTEVLATATGQRVSSVDVPQALGSAAGRYLREMGDSHRLLTEVVQRRGRVDSTEVVNAYSRADDSKVETFRHMARMVQAARNLGIPTIQVMDILESRGLSQRMVDDLMAGTYIPEPASMNLTDTQAARRTAVDPEQGTAAYRDSDARQGALDQGFIDALDRERQRRRKPAAVRP